MNTRARLQAEYTLMKIVGAGVSDEENGSAARNY